MNKSGPERLAAYRDRLKYKQYELADLLDLDVTHLSQILNGKRRPGLEIAVRIEERTGIPAESWLLTPRGRSSKKQAEQAEIDQ